MDPEQVDTITLALQSPRLIDWIAIAAIIIGPIAAVQIDKLLERRRDRRTRKVIILRSLMATRGARLTQEHVGALNLIDIDFESKSRKDIEVKRAWTAYLDVLSNFPKPPSDPNLPAPDNTEFNERREKIFGELLVKIAQSLNYDLDETHLRRGAYTPQGHVDIELDNIMARRGLLALLDGRISLPISVQNGNPDPRIVELTKKVLEGTQSISVQIHDTTDKKQDNL